MALANRRVGRVVAVLASALHHGSGDGDAKVAPALVVEAVGAGAAGVGADVEAVIAVEAGRLDR